MSGARPWLERAFAPVDRLLARLDDAVDPETHVGRARRLLGRAGDGGLDPVLAGIPAALARRCTADLAGAPTPEAVRLDDEARAVLSSAFRAGTLEAGRPERTAQLLGLLPGVFRVSSAPDFELPAEGDWAAERSRLARLWVGLATSEIPRDRAVPVLEAAVAIRPEGRWFLRRGAWYGSAALMRALALAGHEPSGRRLFDRLLRHVEVRREGALAFLPESLPADAEPDLERARFSLALVDAAIRWRDLRYLNAALKLSDYRHRQLGADQKLAAPVGLAHAACIARQESALRTLLRR